MDILTAKNNPATAAEKAQQIADLQKRIADYKVSWKAEYQKLKAAPQKIMAVFSSMRERK